MGFWTKPHSRSGQCPAWVPQKISRTASSTMGNYDIREAVARAFPPRESTRRMRVPQWLLNPRFSCIMSPLFNPFATRFRRSAGP